MQYSKLYFAPIVISMMVSCSNSTNGVSKKVEDFADLECRAITLKNKRFALANELRFTQDTLLKPINKADTSRLRTKFTMLGKEKEEVLQASLALADSIRLRLDDLMKNDYTTKEDKIRFDKLLDSALERRGCK